MKRAIQLTLAAFMAVSLAACATPQGGGGSASARQAEAAQTRALLQELRQKDLLVKGEKLNVYVDEVTARIGAQRPRGSSTLKTFIIKDPSANAFTTGDGHVFINAGLLATMENEAQFAMVLAHEIAHEDLGHVAKGMERQQTVGMIGALGSVAGALLGVPDSLVQLGVGTGGQLYLADFSRDQETEADRRGLKYLIDAGYSAEAGVEAFAVLRRMYGDSSGLAAYFASHPASADRQKELLALAREMDPQGGRVAQQKWLQETNNIRKRAMKVYEQTGATAEARQAQRNLRATK